MPEQKQEALVDTVVQSVLGSSKNKDVSPDLIATIAAQELAKRRNLKEALKATKNKLHQVGGAYLDGRENYDKWLADLRMAHARGAAEELKQVSRELMLHHASTRERIPSLDEFYRVLQTELEPIGPIRRVLDIACGLNPLALPWMGLPPDVEYYGYDIYQQMAAFLTSYLELLGVQGQVEMRDVISNCPDREADLAFVLKVLPCLEQVEKRASYELLRCLNVRYLVVSFPVQSLGGRNKGMADYYEGHFRELIRDEKWRVKRLDIASELVFLVEKSA